MHGRDIVAAARVGTALAAVFAVIVPSYAFADVIEVGADGAEAEPLLSVRTFTCGCSCL